MININEVIKKAIDTEKSKRKEGTKKECIKRYERDRLIREINVKIMPCVRQAITEDYNRWLTGFITKGGEPTCIRDRSPMPESETFVAVKDFTLIPLFGSYSLNIIIPEGITIETPDGLGHCNLYYMEDYNFKGNAVFVFSDSEEVKD